MDKKKLIHYVNYVLDSYDFVKIHINPEELVEKELAKTGADEEKEKNIRKAVKLLVREKIIESYKKNPDKFDYYFMKKLSGYDIDEYTKIAIVSNVFGLLFKDKETDGKFCKEYINNHKPLRRVLNNLFIEEDDDNTVEQELNEKYSHIKEILVQYKKHFYIKEEKSSNTLTMKEIIDLISKYRKGDIEARNIIVEKNIGLCRKLAAGFQRRDNVMTNYDDLVNDGVEGLMKAIDKFDSKKGVRFSTYAVYWIKQSIQRSTYNNFRSIRIPVHKVEWINKINKKINKLEQDEGITDSKELCKRLELSEEEYEEYRKLTAGIGSLNKKVNNQDGDSTEEVGNFIADKEDYTAKAIEKVDKEILLGVLDECLTPREKDVIVKRYGFDGEDERTLENVGKELNVSRERVRQIEAKSRFKIKRYYMRHKYNKQ